VRGVAAEPGEGEYAGAGDRVDPDGRGEVKDFGVPGGGMRRRAGRGW